MEKAKENSLTVSGVASKKINVKKVVTAICSGALAVSVVAVSAFAADGTGTVDYTSLIDTITAGFSDIITNCVTVAAAVLPIGLGLLGLGKIWDVAKRFFAKSTK